MKVPAKAAFSSIYRAYGIFGALGSSDHCRIAEGSTWDIWQIFMGKYFEGGRDRT